MSSRINWIPLAVPSKRGLAAAFAADSRYIRVSINPNIRRTPWEEPEPFEAVEARLWDPATGQPAGPKVKHPFLPLAEEARRRSQPGTAFPGLADPSWEWSQDGARYAFLQRKDKGLSVRVLDMRSGTDVVRPLPHDAADRVIVDFSPDGRRLLTLAGTDGFPTGARMAGPLTARVWGIRLREPCSFACQAWRCGRDAPLQLLFLSRAEASA